MVSEFPDQVNGFIVVPVVFSSSSSSAAPTSTPQKNPVYHTLYLKKHEARPLRRAKGSAGADSDADDDDEERASRTVFVVNLPILTSFNHIKNLCQQVAGVLVEDFEVDQQQGGGSTGRIVLVDKTAAARLISKSRQAYKLEKQIRWTSKGLTNSATAVTNSCSGDVYGPKREYFCLLRESNWVEKYYIYNVLTRWV